MRGKRYSEEERKDFFLRRSKLIRNQGYYIFHNKKRLFADTYKELYDIFKKEWQIDKENKEKPYYY